jgi:hypothetical protein
VGQLAITEKNILYLGGKESNKVLKKLDAIFIKDLNEYNLTKLTSKKMALELVSNILNKEYARIRLLEKTNK